MTLEKLALQGQERIQGSMAGSIRSRIQEIRKDVIKECFFDLEDMEHRLEKVANVHGIEFINDSKATNVNSTWFALESMTEPVIWIAGGVDTGNDYRPIIPLVMSKVKAMIFLGVNNEAMVEAFIDSDIPMTTTQSMSEAVELAYFAGKKGDIVLFSPACASFDLFNDYEERGIAFRKAVRNL